MKEIISTTSSLIIILSCFCLFLTSEETGSHQNIESEKTVFSNLITQDEKTESRSTLFNRVQSVKVKNGVLKFITLQAEGGLREHYFHIRNKNVMFCTQAEDTMPRNSIKFEIDPADTIIVTIPQKYGIDFMEVMAGL